MYVASERGTHAMTRPNGSRPLRKQAMLLSSKRKPALINTLRNWIKRQPACLLPDGLFVLSGPNGC